MKNTYVLMLEKQENEEKEISGRQMQVHTYACIASSGDGFSVLLCLLACLLLKAI